MYCSAVCEERAWPTHAPLCYRFATPPKPVGPGFSERRRAFLFHAEQFKVAAVYPRINGSLCHVSPCFQAQYPRQKLGLAGLYANKWVWVNLHDKRYPVVGFACSKAFLSDSSRSNRTIPHLLKEPNVQEWRGPIIAVVCMPSTTRAREIVDAEDADLAVVINMLNVATPPDYDDQDTGAAAESSTIPTLELTVPCVMVHCEAEMKLRGAPQFLAVNIPAKDVPRSGLVPRLALVSGITSCIGLPLHAQQQQLDSAISGSDLFGARSNSAVSDLFIEIKLSSPIWGFTPDQWRGDVGNVLLAREDGEDLTVEQVEKACGFAKEVIGSLTAKIQGAIAQTHVKEAVMAVLNPESFAGYSQKWDREAARLRKIKYNGERHRNKRRAAAMTDEEREREAGRMASDRDNLESLMAEEEAEMASDEDDGEEPAVSTGEEC